MNSISEYAKSFPASGIRAMFMLAEKYPGYANLCNGEPNFETPQYIKDSAVKALSAGMTRYAPQVGTPAFRQAVADKYTLQFGRECSPKNVCASLGGVEAVILTLMAIVNPGDEVIIPDPSYTCYEAQVRLLGCKVVRVPLYEEDHFRLRADSLEKAVTPKTKAVILNYPNNPVGAVLTPEDAEQLADVIERHSLYVISDEVYEKLVFDGKKHYSLAQVDRIRDQVVIANSLSKTYAMTGWRVGYCFGNAELISHIGEMQQALASCVPGFILQAAADAISGPQEETEKMIAEYEARRDILEEALSGIPRIKVFHTEGSFCMFINIKELGVSSRQLADDLLIKAGVLTVGGQAFGKMGEGYLRVCFANSRDEIREGAKRIAAYFNSL